LFNAEIEKGYDDFKKCVPECSLFFVHIIVCCTALFEREHPFLQVGNNQGLVLLGCDNI
jgi:hypothetical protein